MNVPDANKAIADRGVDFVMAMDVDRVWATGAQAFVNTDFTMLIFREQNLVPDPADPTSLTPAIKNVASLMIPTAIVREFHANLGVALAKIEAENVAAKANNAD